MEDYETTVSAFEAFIRSHNANYPSLEIDTKLIVDGFRQVLGHMAAKKAVQCDQREATRIRDEMQGLTTMMLERWDSGENPDMIREEATEKILQYIESITQRQPLASPPTPPAGHPFANQIIPPRPPPTMLRHHMLASPTTGRSPVPDAHLSSHITGPTSSVVVQSSAAALNSPGTSEAGSVRGSARGNSGTGRRIKPPEIAQESFQESIQEDPTQGVVANSETLAKLRKQNEYMHAFIHERWPDPKKSDKSAKPVCPFCKDTIDSGRIESHIFRDHRQPLEKEFVPADIYVPADYHCRFPECTSRVKSFYRIDVRTQHEATVHGMHNPVYKYSTRRQDLERLRVEVLRNYLISDAKELNALKERVRAAEQQLTEMYPNYQSRHGLDLDTTYPTEAAHLKKTKSALANDLCNLRIDGFKKAKLMCRPGVEGTWADLFDDIERARERVQSGQAPY